VLAFTFGLYGLIKKTAPLSSLHGNALETLIMFLPAVAYLVFEQVRGVGAYVNYGLTTTILLSLAGFVTAIPLLSFAEAARRIPLTTMGILQYLSPTMQFLLGVLVYHEDFDTSRWIGFGIIWLGLIIFSVEGWLASRKASQPVLTGADLNGQPPLS
jgi:chloramphenicol-sensitive protein RarD